MIGIASYTIFFISEKLIIIYLVREEHSKLSQP